MAQSGDSKFRQFCKNLNPAQKEAVEAIDGPVMVIAGPGTGKTQILTLRIANILRRTDTRPEQILALTFTRSGVHSMRRRLVEMIGAAGYRVNIYTFHGFCRRVIQDYAEFFPTIIGGRQIDLVEQIVVLREIISASRLRLLKPSGNPHYHLLSVLREIDRLKRENISPKDLQAIISRQLVDFRATPDLYYDSGKYQGELRAKYRDWEKLLAKNKELLIIYRRYEDALRARRLYDFGDLVLQTLGALEINNDLLLRLQEDYQYFLADEHQDANRAQNQLLKLLVSFHPSPNLFIVGDEKQAIFQFQGASLDNFAYFRRLYPAARLIHLTHNYRSRQLILDAAQSLIEKSPALAPWSRGRLTAAGGRRRPDRGQIDLLVFTSPAAELFWLASELKKEIQAGQKAEELAIIYRDNADAKSLVESLEAVGVAYDLVSEDNVLADRDLQKLLVLIRAVFYFGDPIYLLPLLHLDFLHLDQLALYKLLARRGEESFDLLAELNKNPAFRDFADRYLGWWQAGHNENLAEWLERVIGESGFVDYLLRKPEAAQKIAKLRAVFDQVKNLVEEHPDYRLADLVNYFDILAEHRLTIKSENFSSAGGVKLLTAHRAKGLEFDKVFIINAYDGHWGNKRARRNFLIPTRETAETADRLDDERRLFYVALTRARREVTVTYSAVGAVGQNYLPTQFLEEIDERLIKKTDMPTVPTDLSFVRRPTSNKSGFLNGAGRRKQEYFNQLFLRQGLSITALNNYLECPWRYFFQNLLRLPAAKNFAQCYGVAIHAALKDFFDEYCVRGRAPKKVLLKSFADNLRREPLNRLEIERALVRGRVALGGYYDYYRGRFVLPFANEFAIRGVHLPRLKVKLTGKLDKLELLDGPGAVRVVDYKTGRPRPAAGNYRRQLVFYKILLDHFSGGQYQMVSGLLDFVEPTERGRYRREELTIVEEETAELEETIRRVAAEILELKFWTRRCGRRDCEFCRLRDAF